MPILNEAPNEVRLILDEMLEKFHQPLRDAKVSFDLLAATSKNDEGNPVKLNGYPCYAVAKIIPYKQRAKGQSDAEITIDWRKWEEMTEEQKRALIDHELTHFELKVKKKDGTLTRDDLGRPNLKMRKHDHQFGWFDSIARRHGKASFEVTQAETFVLGALKQRWLPFLSDGFADIKPAKSTPSRVRLTREVMGTADGIAITGKAGDEFDAELSDNGEVLAKVGNHKIMLSAGDFDVIMWVEGEGPKTPKLKGTKVA